MDPLRADLVSAAAGMLSHKWSSQVVHDHKAQAHVRNGCDCGACTAVQVHRMDLW